MAEQNSAWAIAPLGLPPIMVAQHEIQQYLTDFHRLVVPFTPAHCSSAIIWQDQIVPILNLSVLTNEAPCADFKLAVLAYQQKPRTPLHYVALAISQAPEQITVADEAMCDLPEEDHELWRILAQACAMHDGVPTPIISITKLDSVEFCRYAERVFSELSPAEQLAHQQAHQQALASLSRAATPPQAVLVNTTDGAKAKPLSSIPSIASIDAKLGQLTTRSSVDLSDKLDDDEEELDGDDFAGLDDDDDEELDNDDFADLGGDEWDNGDDDELDDEDFSGLDADDDDLDADEWDNGDDDELDDEDFSGLDADDDDLDADEWDNGNDDELDDEDFSDLDDEDLGDDLSDLDDEDLGDDLSDLDDEDLGDDLSDLGDEDLGDDLSDLGDEDLGDDLSDLGDEDLADEDFSDLDDEEDLDDELVGVSTAA